MSEIFISYAHRSDKRQAKQIADALRALGYGVWSDDELPAHRAYSDVIEERLKAAKAVVVVWSADAARSQWVRAEAEVAREAGTLVQLRVDAASPPLPFSQIHCAELAGWNGAADWPGWRTVTASIADLVGAGAQAPARLNNLPRRRGSLIGRDKELSELTVLLGSGDLVTVTGPGGVGKTRLAVEAGLAALENHEDGVWLVELAPVTEEAMVVEAVARATNIELQAGQDPLASLVDRLRARRCLIVLDNCEHLIDAVARLVEAILQRAPDVRLLATSQEPLGADCERVFRLRSLSEPDAVALFGERASAADAAFQVALDHGDAVAAICQRLDGIPLAIEMAAARAPALGCDVLLQRLDDRFRLLTGGRRTALPRHRTLLATLDWSHSLLSATDAAVFRRISVFAGGFTLEAATEVAADEHIDQFAVVEALSDLVAKSLVAADAGAGRARYRLLETARAYAMEKLAEAGETGPVQHRHAAYVLKFVEPSRADYNSAVSDGVFADRYLADSDNIERALDWAFGPDGDPEIGIAITADSVWVYAARSRYRDYVRRVAAAEARLTPATAPAALSRLQVGKSTAYMVINEGMPPGAADEAVEAARSADDPPLLAQALNASGISALIAGRLDDARAHARESLALLADAPRSRLTGQAYWLAAYIRLVESGELAARPLFERVVADLRSIGADGLANFFLLTGVSSSIPNDNRDVAIVGLRDTLARIQPWHMYAGLSTGLSASHLAHCLATRGDPGDVDEAREVGRTYRKVALRGVGGGPMYLYYMAMAWIAARSGRPRAAANIGGYVEAIRAAQGNALSRAREEMDRLRASLAGRLPEAEITAWWAEGARLDQDDVDALIDAES